MNDSVFLMKNDANHRTMETEKVLRRKRNHQPRIVYMLEISFKNENRLETFSDIEKLGSRIDKEKNFF